MFGYSSITAMLNVYGHWFDASYDTLAERIDRIHGSVVEQ